LKYKFEYLDHRRTGIEGVEAFTGKRVHESLRLLYEDFAETDSPVLEHLADFYKSRWDEEWHSGVRIVRKGTRPSDYFNHGLQCLQNFYEGYWHSDETRTVVLEGTTVFWLDRDAGREFKCVLDRVALRSDGTYEIHDYKTGRREPDLREAEVQLSLYQMALETEVPEADSVELVLHDLPRAQTHRNRQRRSSLNRIFRNTSELVDRIESERNFRPHPNYLCAWCEFRRICPAFGWRSKVTFFRW